MRFPETHHKEQELFLQEMPEDEFEEGVVHAVRGLHGGGVADQDGGVRPVAVAGRARQLSRQQDLLLHRPRPGHANLARRDQGGNSVGFLPSKTGPKKLN